MHAEIQGGKTGAILQATEKLQPDMIIFVCAMLDNSVKNQAISRLKNINVDILFNYELQEALAMKKNCTQMLLYPNAPVLKTI